MARHRRLETGGMYVAMVPVAVAAEMACGIEAARASYSSA